jgi:hypothetical protein
MYIMVGGMSLESLPCQLDVSQVFKINFENQHVSSGIQKKY